VQEELPANDPFVNWISWDPEMAVNVPPQLLTGAAPAAITNPAGRESLNPKPVKPIFPVFRIVIVS
jgi:hypothetical protein